MLSFLFLENESDKCYGTKLANIEMNNY